MAGVASGIVVVDYGSQYTMLIARRLRELGVYSEVVRSGRLEARMLDGARGIILSGGPASSLEEGAPGIADAILDAGMPLLGICYGMQALAGRLGGDVRPCSGSRGYGPATIRITEGGRLLGGLAEGGELACWMSHGDEVAAPPPGFAVLAEGPSAAVTAMADEARSIYGLQFHPEVVHTDRGGEILRRFAIDVCGCAGDWTMPAFIDSAADAVREQVGGGRILLGLSGGIDSAVAAALIERAVPGQLVCVFVDNGLLREGEAVQVSESFAHLGDRLHRVDAADRFFGALRGIEDPEEKRKAIGRVFIEVFKDEAGRIGEVRWLGQGTIYPDVIESDPTTGAGTPIKSHHNVGGLPEDLGLDLVEPLRRLFKDEVRALGAELGLPAELLGRHPFPGPGLAVRVLGEVTPERVAINRAADRIFIDHLRESGWYGKVAQAFPVLLPVRSVGVKGDSRSYENIIALRAVTTDDFMTADWARLPDELLGACSREIINGVDGVNRVVYDISSKPPATVEWE